MKALKHQVKPNGELIRRLVTVTVERPRCPTCGSAALRKYRSLRDQGDGSSLWWVRCECGARFRVLLE